MAFFGNVGRSSIELTAHAVRRAFEPQISDHENATQLHWYEYFLTECHLLLSATRVCV